MVVRKANQKKRVKWCKERRHRTVDNYWEKVIFSDESQIVLCTNNRVYIWQKNDKKYNIHFICSRSEQKISLMIWECICYDGVGTLTAVEGNINSMVSHLFQNNDTIYMRFFPHVYLQSFLLHDICAFFCHIYMPSFQFCGVFIPKYMTIFLQTRIYMRTKKAHLSNRKRFLCLHSLI